MTPRNALTSLAAAAAGHAVPIGCLLTFGVLWIALAVAPLYRLDWLLENLLSFVAIPVVVLTYRRFRFSDRAYVQATAFVILHTVGSHYTYSEVPLGAWISDLFGSSRNHYDRLVHFAFGALMALPIRELLFARRPGKSRLAAVTLTVAVVGGVAAAYEVLEWLMAIVVNPSAGQAFLGTQGDVWDPQKDMGLALVGAMIAAALEPDVSGTTVAPARRASEEDARDANRG
jgi:putative membrane protein